MPGIGVIFNPRSGRNLRDPRAARRLARSLGDHGVIREAGSIDELYRVAEDFRRLEIDVLGISGGDGTNGTTITGFIDVYEGNALPQLAFLRGGTMNTVANSVGVRRRAARRSCGSSASWVSPAIRNSRKQSTITVLKSICSHSGICAGRKLSAQNRWLAGKARYMVL